MVTNHISDSARIGQSVSIWHFAYVGENTEIGNNVKTGSLAHVNYDVTVGESIKIEKAHTPPHTRIGKNVFIGQATFTNDPYPMCGCMAGATAENGAIGGVPDV